MAQGILQHLTDLQDFLKPREPLAPYAYLKLGGPAEVLALPRTRAELAQLVQRCFANQIPLRVLGSGCNILVRDEGVTGVVIRLSEPAFCAISIEGRRVSAGAGASLANAISATSRHGLAGLETLVGIAGTIGGAVRDSSGERTTEIGQYIRRVEVLDRQGQAHWREREELQLGSAALDDPVLLGAELELETDGVDAIVKRMRKAWIQRKASQPFTFQAAGRIFKNPRGLSAAALIEQAGLAGTKVGGAEVSERDPNYIVAAPTASARDVLRLIELVRARVQERFQLELELEISVW